MSVLVTIKSLGFTGAASYAFGRFATGVRVASWHRAHVVAVPRARLPRMPRGFMVRPLTASELAFHSVDVTPAQQAERFRQGIECLGAFNGDGLLTGLVWMTDRGCTEGDLALFSAPPAGAAWDTGMWIHPDHRMGRTFQALWAGVGEWLDARGLDWSCSAIADYNISSMGAHQRLGLQVISRITALRIGYWQWIAVGDSGWRFVRMPNILRWQVPPPQMNSSDSNQAAPPSLAA